MPENKSRKGQFDSLRQRAEKLVKQDRADITSLSRQDIEHLAYELAVHQVELEAQNEELRQTQVKLAEARDRYADLYDFAPVGYLTLDQYDLVIEANLTICQMLGIDRADLLQKRISDYIAPESQNEFYHYLRHAQRADTRTTGEFEMLKNGGTYFQAHLESLPTGEGNLRAGIIDITEQKKAEEALKRSEERYRNIVETANEGILIGATDGRILFANQRMADLLGYPLSEIIGKAGLDFMDSDQTDLVLRTRKELQSGKKLRREFKFRRKDGSILWTEASVTPQFDGNGHQITNFVMHTDITERRKAEEALVKSRDELEIKVQERTKQLQEAYDEVMQSQKALKAVNKQLKQYATRITQVQEEERKRIAYELHDDTAQYLSILKMQIGALAESGDIQNPKVKEKLHFLEQDADRAFNDVRRYSHELRPTTLEHQGLVGALEQIAADFNKLGQLAIEVHIEGMEPELSEEVKLGFFRVAQEAINNTRKHAKAGKAIIHLKFQKKQIAMEIVDDGIGFSPQEAKTRSGEKGNLGLLSMKERADLIGASLKIESASGKGTKVKVKVKL
jgi:PAS domain S-box-containing protein